MAQSAVSFSPEEEEEQGLEVPVAEEEEEDVTWMLMPVRRQDSL